MNKNELSIEFGLFLADVATFRFSVAKIVHFVGIGNKFFVIN